MSFGRLMSLRISFIDDSLVRRLALGGLCAAALGGSAGAALRMEPAEQARAAAPQQIVVPDVQLAALERAGRGWPARRQS